ncbi:MAG: thioredoxin family protein [Oscillospiraceae bacterium]|jgi:thioredoxin-like negative regulator of GroEL|nr:thioredoxin family protein [Oscillospiraceae bacterium]
MELSELREGEFDEKQKEISALVFFYTSWCKLCDAVREMLQELQAESIASIEFYQVDYDACKELLVRYDIIGVPTVLALHCGELVDYRAGLRDRAHYTEMMEALLRVRKYEERNAQAD